MNNPIKELEKFGQSIWLDNISRGMLNRNELKNLVDEIGLKGVTSNPTIFQKAIGAGTDYDAQLKSLIIDSPDQSSYELFESLAVKDIQDAADVLYPVYESSNGKDGFVSLEVSPKLANNTDETIEEARRLNHKVNRRNVMIKIPATKEGIPAIKQMISEGVNINVTLIFSQERYEEVVEAYISGLEEREKRGEGIKGVSSVASFFISRIDSMVDDELEQKGNKELQGKIAIANAKLVYQKAKELFGSERFKKLEDKGAKVQRLLWASTSTKNPEYSPVLYVDELIGQETVNTLPPETIDAYKEKGKPADRIETNINEANNQMQQLKKAGIDFADVTQRLEDEGVKKFADSFIDLLQVIEKKKSFILAEGSSAQQLNLPDEINSSLKKRLSRWQNENILGRLWENDPTIWKEKKEDDIELSNRLGWLNLPKSMQGCIDELTQFSQEVKKEFSHIILLGMGGSSLAPAVFFKIFGNEEGYPTLEILDSTHPEVIKNIFDSAVLKKTLFIVSSKSGSTTETMSFFYKAFEEISRLKDNPGENFVAVTDGGSSLEKLAEEKKFRRIFNTQPAVGGRYSVLTFFGLLPAALIGMDIKKLLDRACLITVKTLKDVEIENSPGIVLGAALGELALAGRDKLTIVTSPKISPFPAWIEQLIAESTGKEGTGILPVIEEDLSSPEAYGKDRAFVFLRLNGDENSDLDNGIKKLKAARFPVIEISLNDEYDLGKEFFRWEAATAMAGAVLNINPFDQPNVQLAKTLAKESMEQFKKNGELPQQTPSLVEDDISFFGKIENNSLVDSFKEFLAHARKDNYVAIMSFVPYSEELDKNILNLKKWIRDNYNLAVTSGYGPRFLHSTGQLHKGDGNTGLFIQITCDAKEEVEIPGEGYSFNTLITAQALGDWKALTNSNRRIIRLHFAGDTAEGVGKILDQL